MRGAPVNVDRTVRSIRLVMAARSDMQNGAADRASPGSGTVLIRTLWVWN